MFLLGIRDGNALAILDYKTIHTAIINIVADFLAGLLQIVNRRAERRKPPDSVNIGRLTPLRSP